MDPNPAPLPDRFTHRHGGTVIITMNDGTVHRNTCEAPRGSGPRGVEWADVDAKYRRLVPLSGLAADKLEASLQVVHNFTAVKSMSELTGLLLK